MNLEKVKKAVNLQIEANLQIEWDGEAHPQTINELMLILDTLTSEEQDKFIELYNASC